MFLAVKSKMNVIEIFIFYNNKIAKQSNSCGWLNKKEVTVLPNLIIGKISPKRIN